MTTKAWKLALSVQPDSLAILFRLQLVALLFVAPYNLIKGKGKASSSK